MPEWLRGKDHNEFEVYAMNVPVYELFNRVKTQWRSEGVRRMGLDYNPIFSYLDRMQVPNDEQVSLMESLAFIEAGAVTEFDRQLAIARSKKNK